MRIVGLSAGVINREGNVDRMVKAILDKSGFDAEFVKLTDLTYSGCKGCAQLCAKPQVCKLEDDLLPHYETIKQADAVVVGAPVYFGSVNAIATAFLERFYGYRHVTNAIAGKPFVLVTVGGMRPEKAEAHFRRLLQPFEVDILDSVIFGSNVPPCFICGRHRTCSIGGLYYMIGEAAHSLDITQDMFSVWEDDPKATAAVASAAEKLRALAPRP